MESTATRAWIEKQNQLTELTLSAVPERESIRARLEQLMRVDTQGVPYFEGGRRFMYIREAGQNQPVLFVGVGSEGWRPLLDPNTLSTDGTATIGATSVCDNGRHIAYAIQRNGLDQQEWRVRNIDTGEDLPDTLAAKFSEVSWLPDGSGFFYTRFPHQDGGHFDLPDENNKVYFHRLGDAQSEDTLVYELPEHPNWGFTPRITANGRWLLITATEGTENKNVVYVRPLADASTPFTAFPSDEKLAFELSYVDSDGDTAYFRTTMNAPRGKLIAVDLKSPDLSKARTVIDELPWPGAPLADLKSVRGGFVATTMRDAASRLLVFNREGRIVREISPSVPGTIDNLSYDRTTNTLHSTYESFNMPRTTYALDLSNPLSTPRATSHPRLSFNPSDFEVSQVRYPSRDGTEVPMFLVRKKNVVPNGAVPTILYGYGGFNIPLTPTFSAGNLAWMEMGGLLAIPNLRGGGEFGEDWHGAGMRGRKQNVFDDFIAAAEWLIANGWTNRNRMAASGASNGGLLVGAVITQRPDLFGAALPAVGVLDMLRYQEFSAGKHWMPEYGASHQSEEALHWLRRYSPLHNVSEGMNYPATLVTTGDHDDRVVPLHSYKFAAALQRAQGGPQPILLRVDVNGGHGAGKPVAMQIRERADVLAFLFEMLHMRGMTRP